MSVSSRVRLKIYYLINPFSTYLMNVDRFLISCHLTIFLSTYLIRYVVEFQKAFHPNRNLHREF